MTEPAGAARARRSGTNRFRRPDGGPERGIPLARALAALPNRRRPHPRSRAARPSRLRRRHLPRAGRRRRRRLGPGEGPGEGGMGAGSGAGVGEVGGISGPGFGAVEGSEGLTAASPLARSRAQRAAPAAVAPGRAPPPCVARRSPLLPAALPTREENQPRCPTRCPKPRKRSRLGAENKRIALLIAALALALALTEVAGDDAKTEAQMRNVESANLWAFFQARTVRQTVLSAEADRGRARRRASRRPRRARRPRTAGRALARDRRALGVRARHARRPARVDGAGARGGGGAGPRHEGGRPLRRRRGAAPGRHRAGQRRHHHRHRSRSPGWRARSASPARRSPPPPSSGWCDRSSRETPRPAGPFRGKVAGRTNRARGERR